jgi:hypothetical protein
MTPVPSTARPQSPQAVPFIAASATSTDVASARRVLRNRYALLSMTLLLSTQPSPLPAWWLYTCRNPARWARSMTLRFGKVAAGVMAFTRGGRG